MLRRNLPSLFPLLALVGLVLGLLRNGGEISVANAAIMLIGGAMLGFIGGRFPAWTKHLGRNPIED